ncbi:uncharacterized protein ACLA_011170 [Aspergillus clavatus NRRL 1]|uniref:Uncharacterized protein n=1 Tax=Aspergillus clavatus (strain ATCC 1007 / CBS 513.65 / DSM 816 / NCTC 3887 / NRRL 1 / QM 1276 / 107) TaxID=344612 RepID=A1CAC2_ASPCL|nr:uncharacterized protein ACLA_011170 [Aspergillus clavatus NRRL 1]EAW12690.1 conserved hypothetical protein [Aspergillus clavatus NRRL 1]
MPALTTVLAVAAVCAALFIVSVVVGTLVWVKARRERRALAAAGVARGRYARSLQAFEADTATSLSREEGSALRLYGQLPYGRPNEWGLLASRESLLHSPIDSETSSQFTEKARSLRRSLSLSRSRSTRQLKGLIRPRPTGPLAPLAEAAEKSSDKIAGPKDHVSLSAIEGVLELPTETTPRQTPEKEDDRINMQPCIRPMSAAVPSIHIRERSGNLFPLLEMEDYRGGFEQSQSRVRGGSITNQTAGAMPQQPVPPPPSAYPPNRFRLSKNDSMRHSSLSLETADSSILDENLRTSTGMDSNFTSPALPPCPTFAPFSANDVGRTEFERRGFAALNPALPIPFTFPGSTATREDPRLEPSRSSPRRSMTARHPSHTERASPPPRRSGSVCSSQSRREIASMPYLDPSMTPQLNATSENPSMLLSLNQMHRHSMYASRDRDVDPFFGGLAISSTSINISHTPGRRASSLYVPEASAPGASSASKPPLASALKNGNGPRKGHKRQNCVRISIHPPITFGGPAFSPTVEEPEEVEDLDNHRNEASNLAGFNFSTIRPTISSSSGSKHSSYDSQKARLRATDVSSTPYGSPTKKRKHNRTDSNDCFLSPAGSDKTLPEIVTSLPNTSDGTLSQTPSPEKTIPLWMLPAHADSPTTRENVSPPQNSRRRSAVKGPRTQPGGAASNNTRAAAPLDDSEAASTQSGSPEGRFRPSSRPHSGSREAFKSDNPSQNEDFNSASQESRTSSEADSRRNSASQKPPDDLACGVHKTMSTRSGNMVTIWEDTEHKTKRAQAKYPASSPRKSRQKGSQKAKSDDRDSHKSSQRTSRQGITTPTGKTIGLGIGAATPGSLYDGDGFLKE